MSGPRRVVAGLVCAGFACLVSSLGHGEELGYLEDFAVAPDREKVIESLIPGSADYCYYHALHYQNTGQLDKVAPLLKVWEERHRDDGRRTAIENRQILLSYDAAPEQALERLRQRLNLTFRHQRERTDIPSGRPTALDQDRITRDRFLAAARAPQRQNVEQFEPTAYDWLITRELTAEERRDLLSRLDHPDYPDLPVLIAGDLNHARSVGFGSHNVHKLLTLEQLAELRGLKPELIDDATFIATWLSSLRPGPDVDVERDLPARRAYLERLWEFAADLAPAHNTLKLNILHHRLLLDRKLGVHDIDRFRRYIAIPRHAPYVNDAWFQMQRSRHPDHLADLSVHYREATLLPPVGNDEPLIRAYLIHFFTTEDHRREFRQYLHGRYLDKVFAEARLLAGVGDAEELHSPLLPGEPGDPFALLRPGEVQALRDRVDIDFAPTNPGTFEPGAPVALEVDIKNVEQLLVRVYRINELNYYLDKGKEVDTAIALDGLAPNHEAAYTYADPPIRRVRRTFELKQIDAPGVWVVELIGSGRSSRAVICIGRLRYTVQNGPAGHVFRIYDQANQPRPEAKLLIEGHQYEPDDRGRIVVPYTTRPGRQKIILVDGDRATLDAFRHEREVYRFDAGFHLERESIIAGQQAELIIRPTLRLGGAVQPIGLLENVRLTVAATDPDGVASGQTVTGFELDATGETVHRFQVPPRVREITVRLDARVPSVSTPKDVEVAATARFNVNEVAATEKLALPHLTRDGADYILEVRGRNGETRPGELVSIDLRHRDVKTPILVNLQSDERGRVHLGPLVEIASIDVRMADGLQRDWTLHEPAYSYLPSLTAAAGEPILLPWMRDSEEPVREELGLLELRDGKPVADRFDAIQMDAGCLVLRGLGPGDYTLLMKRDGRRIGVHVTEGTVRGGHVLGRLRYLERVDPRPMALLAPQVDKAKVRIPLRHAGTETRVHVFASRYMDAFHAWESLHVPAREAPRVIALAGTDSIYVAGRNIGDEYRYILDRRSARRFPGNMLARPGLLLNPWAVCDTTTGELIAAGGEDDRQLSRYGGTSASGRRAGAEVWRAERSDPQDLNFLARPAVVKTNLRPGEDGVVEIDRAELGDRHVLWIVAVDGEHTAWRPLALPEVEPALRDRRVVKALDAERHFIQRRNIDVLMPGDAVSFQDLTEARLAIYDSIGAVYRLFMTLNEEFGGDDKLGKFAFIVGWPKLEPEEKRETYAEFACHELHFFLYHKDRAFFDEVVRPHLANKQTKTFMDHYLLAGDLSPYADRWVFGRLNAAERVLLGRRLGQQERMSRHIADRDDLIPPDIHWANQLFEMALQGSALATEGITREFEGQVLRQVEVMEELSDVAADPFGEPSLSRSSGARSMEGAARSTLGAPAPERYSAMDLASRGPLPDDTDDPFGQENAAFASEMARRRNLDEARAARRHVRRFYRDVAPTVEYAENNYYQRRITEQDADLVPVNAFWRDYARHDEGPFLSTKLAEANGNFTEMMLALSVLDLPFEPAEHELSGLDPDADVPTPVTLTAASPLVAYYRQIEPAEPAEEEMPILVSQNFFQCADRYREVDGERVDKFVTDEFLVQTVYGAQVVVTNPASGRQRLDVLLQVPEGAMPVLGDRALQSRHVSLEPFETVKIEYHFYFPEPGDYAHFPVHVARRESLAAFAPPFRFNVVKEPTEIDRENWDYVSQHGTEEQVLEFVETNNVESIDLTRIAWRMRDAAFFSSVVELLEARFTYDDTLWSYSLMHNHLPAMRQYLRHQDSFVQRCGSYLESTLLAIDPVERRAWELLEYDPLVNARAHQLGPRRKIVNPAVHRQYMALLDILAHKPGFDATDRMTIVYYLLLQDRVGEALDVFAQVDPEQLDARLQYDYFRAYLAFYTDDLAKARRIAEARADHAVDRWRKRFENVLAQLDQIEGKAEGRIVDADDRDQQQERLAETDPALQIRVEGDRIELAYANLDCVQVNYYLMDIELLFSTQPFVTEYGRQFAYLRPNRTDTVALLPNEDSMAITLPDEMARRNVMIEVVGGPIKRAATHFSNRLDARMMENYGQLQVRRRGEERGYGGVYVKVYARMSNGNVRFYKDGYTDLRGRFDYASVSGDRQAGAERFAILILSDECGAVVREAPAPKR
ncbi:MAG: hypothetical protein RBS80_00660 [Thermoguttaceae bacterium]|jgi:hypothetical protein|nr:hypothetical protein [Thermoguttaceae bacterium]